MLPAPDPTVPAVGVHKAQEMIEDGAILIDIREADEWQAARIPGAVFHPMSEINEWYEGLDAKATIIVHCRTGQRSETVTRSLLEQAGFSDTHNLLGGLVAWHEAGLAVDFEAPS